MLSSPIRSLVIFESEILLEEGCRCEIMDHTEESHLSSNSYPSSDFDIDPNIPNSLGIKGIKGIKVTLGGRKIYVDNVPKTDDTEPILLVICASDVIDSIAEYISIPRKNSTILWTSQWFWEILQKKLPEEINSNVHFLHTSWDKINSKESSGVYVVTFEEFHREVFGPQIEMTLEYDISAVPSLLVEFRFWSRSFIYRPFKVNCPEKWFSGTIKALNAELYSREIVLRGEKRYPDFFKSMQNTIQRRITNIARHSQQNDRDYIYEIEDSNSFEESKHLDTLYNQLKGTTNWDENGFKHHDFNDKGTRKIKPYLIIGCGANSLTSANAVTPTRRIVLSDAENQKQIEVSFLELKLLEWKVAATAKPDIFQKTVFLMVSPHSEVAIRAEVEHFKKRHGLNSELDIKYIYQSVVKVQQNGKYFQWKTDNGFEYTPSGHGSILSLHEQLKETIADDWFYYISCHNLGKNLTEKFEVKNGITFELYQKSNASLLKELENGHSVLCNKKLIKKIYFTDKWNELEERFRQYEGREFWVFTGSVLFQKMYAQNYNTIQRHFYKKTIIEMQSPREELVSSRSSDNDFYAIWNDLDSITWDNNSNFIEVVKSKVIEPYIGFRKESDLSTDMLNRVFSTHEPLLVDTIHDIRKKTPLKNITPHIYLLDSVQNYAPWGGYEISYRKGEAYENRVISESWEGSFYSGGMNRIKARSYYNVSPYDILDCSKESQPNIMTKFLDVQKWLSIQVHPYGGFAEIISRVDTKSQMKTIFERYKDDAGKLERFVVLRKRDIRDDDGGFYFGVKSDFAHLCGEGLDKIESFDEIVKKINTEQKKIIPDVSDESKQYFKDVVLKNLRKIYDLRKDEEKGVSLKIQSLMLIIGLIETLRRTGYYSDINKRDFRDHLFYRIPLGDLNSGDVINVPPGMIHAAGPGLLLLEASQDSDNTFRILDTDRERPNSARETHYALAALSVSDENFGGVNINTLKSDRERSSVWAVDIKRIANNSRQDDLKGNDFFLLNPSNEAIVELKVSKTENVERVILPEMHSALVKLGANREGCSFSVQPKGVGPYEAYAVATRSKDVNTRIWVSLTGYDIAVYTYRPGERPILHKKCFHDLCPEELSFNGDVKEKIISYLKDEAKINDGSGEKEFSFVVNALPGFKGDARTSEDVDFKTSVYDSKDIWDIIEVAEGAKHIVFSVEAAAMIEERDVYGQLYSKKPDENKPGVVLNLSTGVCLTFRSEKDREETGCIYSFDEKNKPINPQEESESVWNKKFYWMLGRSVFFNIRSNKWVYREGYDTDNDKYREMVKTLGNLDAENVDVFTENGRPLENKDEYIRLSRYISTPALTLRLLLYMEHRLKDLNYSSEIVDYCMFVLCDLGRIKSYGAIKDSERLIDFLVEYKMYINIKNTEDFNRYQVNNEFFLNELSVNLFNRSAFSSYIKDVFSTKMKIKSLENLYNKALHITQNSDEFQKIIIDMYKESEKQKCTDGSESNAELYRALCRQGKSDLVKDLGIIYDEFSKTIAINIASLCKFLLEDHRINRSCFERVILTGHAGRTFGLNAVGEKDESKTDSFVEYIEKNIDKKRKVAVLRSKTHLSNDRFRYLLPYTMETEL